MHYSIFFLIVKVIFKNDVRMIFKGNPPGAPPSFLMDSIVSPKVKIMKGKGVRAHTLVCNTSRVKGHARIS